MRLPLLAAALCGICLISCTDDMGREPVPSAQVSFLCTVSPATSAPAAMPQGSVVAMQGGSSTLYLHTLNAATVTRATPVTSMYDSFGVSAYQYTDTWTGESETPNFFYDQTATRQTDGGGYAFESGTYYWPGAASHMRFFAYAPVDNSNYQLSGETEKGAPTLTVTVPSDVADQEDLLVAASDELKGDNESAVSLNFSHALTAVRFVCGDLLSGTVNSITISGVCDTGTYNIYTGEWTVSDTSTADFSQTLGKSVDGTEGTSITTEAQTFMMIPQKLPADATLTVSFTDSKSNTEHTLTANIGNTAWTKGQTVTYKISSSSINWTYTLSVTGPAETYGCTGGTQQYTVSSYRTHNGKSTTEAVAWETEYSVDGGATWTDDAPTWLTDFTDSGEGGEEGTSYDATLGAQTITASTGDHIYTLQKATACGTKASPYNLANQTDGGTTVENTANCYVVNAPGYYSFPLVYGNAIKDSETNSSAYTSTATGTNVLTPFINHLGNGITDPYIANNTGCTPATAELVWQDAENLVTDIQYNAGSSTTDGTISFYVDRATIRQGNAVIAVKDASGNVLWSWHIWVTDETISADNTIAVTNYQETTINFMPVNLGWCEGETVTFGTAERTCQVKFTAGSDSNEQTQTITLTQSYGTVTTYDGNPYYQWGRKDPFIPSNRNGTTFTNKTWYNASGTSSTNSPTMQNFGTGSSGVKNYILNPGVMTNNSNGDYTYANLWSTNNSIIEDKNLDVDVVKTVYDPSPVGFSVPKGNAYTGFTTTGQTTKKEAEVNGTWDDTSYGYSFNADADGVTILFPFQPYRNKTSANIVTDGQSFYWAAVPYLSHTGYYLDLLLKFPGVYPTSNSYRGYGSCVRPAKEQ